MEGEYDIAVVGGGIAGLSAGLAAARLGRRAVVLTGGVLGGQLLSIERIDGYPGFPDGVPGYDLCPMVEEQAAAAGADFAATEATALAPAGGGWRLDTGEGPVAARGVVIATGTHLRTLGVPGEERLFGRGVSHCASCDAPLLRGKPVVVVGGGDSAAQEALTLAPHASSITIVHRGAALSAQAAYRDRLSAQANVIVRFGAVVEEVLGADGVTGVRVRDTASGAAAEVAAAGVFVFVGLAPNTAFLDGRLALDAAGRIVTDAALRTGLPGISAAGTVRAGAAGRAAASAGDGVAAAVALDRFLGGGAWR
ncbi:MAG: NAD(P)/FAD-dependent oxidoreductase [Rhodospirillaceae bacterium]